MEAGGGTCEFHSPRVPYGDMAGQGVDEQQDAYMRTEACILVNETDDVVGHDTKQNCHLWKMIEERGMLHRAFSVFLFNSKGELLLQQRAGSKITFPLFWTNTCCSHPLFVKEEMETNQQIGVKRAARRKLHHELGIRPEDVALDDLHFLTRIHYRAPSDGLWGEHEVDYILFMQKDVDVLPNANEVEAVRYVSAKELEKMIEEAEKTETKITPWFALIVKNFLYAWWKQLDHVLDLSDCTTIHHM